MWMDRCLEGSIQFLTLVSADFFYARPPPWHYVKYLYTKLVHISHDLYTFSDQLHLLQVVGVTTHQKDVTPFSKYSQ